MKRGKDDEKILEPLFPRLHVNDTDKGGPRAPPRNKMALYEQLSIPSQRFNHQGTLNASNTGSLVPGPSNQACGMERNLYYQHQVSASALAQPAEKFVAQKPCMENVKSLAGHDQRKIVGEEDDLMVPVFLNSKRVQSHDRTKSEMNKENPSCEVLTSCNRSVEIQEVNSKDPKQIGSLSASSRQVVTELVKENPRRGAMISTLDLSARELINVSKSASKCDRIQDAHLRQEFRNRLVENGRKTVTRGTKDGVDSRLRGESHSGEGHSSPDEVSNDNEPCRRRTSATLKERNGEASDGVSETSMVDSISSTDISPDDVVGIIGQKRFWKARRAIANQQRVFAVQVFELHRLIKVQRLIAESPHLLLDDGTYLRKYSPESSPVKKLLSGEYGVKPFPRVAKCINDSEKDNHHKMECSAENAVGRTSVSSGKNLNNNHHHPPSNYMPVVSAASETQMTATSGGGGSWCFPPQPPSGNHQWLIPVMSPSEGLIYKPYMTPGAMGSGCGVYYSHFMPAPMGVNNFMGGPVYGLPAPPPYHPGVGFPSPGPGYFPPYAMPTMNPNLSSQHQQHQEQVNQFGIPNPPSANMNQFGIPNPPSVNMNTQQSSCNFPSSNNNGSVAAAMQTQQQRQQLVAKPRPRNRESSRVVQGSTGSSPGDRGGSGNITGIFGNASPLFPAAPATDNSRGNEQLLTTTTTTATTTTVTMPMPPTMVETKVIRVVPHNPKAASESAARIFRSIQEERKQYESSV